MWTQGHIEERQECFVCIRIWRHISEAHQSNASTHSIQYNVVRDLRVRERTSENMSEGVWAVYHVEITGDGMSEPSSISFSVKPLSGEFYQAVTYINMLILTKHYAALLRNFARLTIAPILRQPWLSQATG